MDFLLGRKTKKSKQTESGSKGPQKEDEKIRKQLEKEVKKQEKLNTKNKSENLKQISSLHTSSNSNSANN